MRATATIGTFRRYTPTNAGLAINAATNAVAAPFIGLLFVFAVPIVALGALIWVGGRALMRNAAARYLKNVLLFAAAPFIGLAYAVAFPFVGLGTLAWYGVRAARARKA